MDKTRRELHVLATFVHGVLCSFHVLGALYNYKRRNYKQAALHVAVAGYDAWAVAHHHQEAKNEVSSSGDVSNFSYYPSDSA